MSESSYIAIILFFFLVACQVPYPYALGLAIVYRLWKLYKEEDENPCA